MTETPRTSSPADPHAARTRGSVWAALATGTSRPSIWALVSGASDRAATATVFDLAARAEATRQEAGLPPWTRYAH